MTLPESSLRAIVDRMVRVFADFLRERTVEQHYSPESVAKLLDVTERSVWTYHDLWVTTGGREGLGPVVKLSFKATRFPASAVNRFLRARTIATPTQVQKIDAEDASEAAAAPAETREAVV